MDKREYVSLSRDRRLGISADDSDPEGDEGRHSTMSKAYALQLNLFSVTLQAGHEPFRSSHAGGRFC